MSLESNLSNSLFFTQRVGEIHSRDLKIIPPEMPVFEAARLMSEEKVACLFVGDPSIEGFVTDITLRDKVLAQNLSASVPVGTIMDKNLVAISNDALLYEALLLMFKTKTRYLLVQDKDNYIGLISRNKILTAQYQGPFILIQSIKQSQHTEELAQKWKYVPNMVYRLVERGLRAQIINQIITTINDAIALRVIENTIREMGPAPASFVFMVLGSEGRSEQSLVTDQDNAIIYEDKANEQRELVRDYFLEFAEKVSAALDTIGFEFCKGGYMAKNPKWTHSLSHWKRNYEAWITSSTPETMMKYATFFDCRAIYGDFTLLDELRAFMDQQLQHPTEKFFINLGTNALQYEPPLTFFRKHIKTFKIDGEEHFNIKHTMTPIVDLTRLFALKHRIFETNTGNRIEKLQAIGAFSAKESKELSHAYYYLMGLRLEKQSLSIIRKG